MSVKKIFSDIQHVLARDFRSSAARLSRRQGY
jgi:hypothetical protein